MKLARKGAGTEKGLVDGHGLGKVWVGWTGRVGFTHIHHCVQNGQLVGACWIARELSSGLCDDLDKWGGEGREVQEEGDRGIHIAFVMTQTSGVGRGGRPKKEGIEVYRLLVHFIIRASQAVLVVKNMPANAGDIRDTGLVPGLHKRHRFSLWVRKIPWRRAWQLTAVFLPGGSHGQRSLGSSSPWGCKESDTTKST